MDYEKRKNEILTDYFKSGRLKIKIDGYYKGKLQISRYTRIAEEIELQVWLELSKYPAEKMVKRVEANPNSIEALAVVIAKYQMMHKKSNPDSPNNSFGTKLIFGSNYFNSDYVSPTDTYNESGDDKEYMGIPISQDENFFLDRDTTPDRWEVIQKRLTPDEIEFITALWNGEKFYKRKPTNAYKEYRNYIFQKIKAMDLNKAPDQLENIRNKLSMRDNKLFEIIFDDDLSTQEKIIKLNFRSKGQYIVQKRNLIKRIKKIQ